MSDKRVLVVEAEKTQKFCLSKLLANSGYSVSSVEVISEALQFFDAESPDIILIDEKLPDGDGFTLCQRVSNFKLNIQVVMMCECSRSFEKEKARALGAHACLAKPFSYEILHRELSKIN